MSLPGLRRRSPAKPPPKPPAERGKSGAARGKSPAKPPAKPHRGLRRRRRPGGGLTGRALVLGVVVVLMTLVLAAPLQRYLQQRHALTAAVRQRSATSKQVVELQVQLDRWKDPAYVERQARARLQYARPGDTVYVVVDPARATPDPSTQQNAPVTTTAGPTSWQTRAWTTLQVADDAP